VDVNRGEISLKSAPGQGVEIEIRLPTTRPSRNVTSTII
jgi:chemotaxis protein histidine kinase CheA